MGEAMVAETAQTEYGWLIELAEQRPGGPVYWSGLTPMPRERIVMPEWTTDNLLAVRFARKEDGERVARGIPLETKVVEHGWG